MKKHLCALLALLLLTACNGEAADNTQSQPIPESQSQSESQPEPEPESAEPEIRAFPGLAAIEADFTSIEDAIIAYIGGVAAGDLYGALSACAIHSYGYGYNLPARVDRLQFYQMERDMGPVQFPMYSEVNASIQMGNLASQTKVFAECLTTGNAPDVVPAGMVNGSWTGDGATTGTFDSYFAQMDPGKLQGLKVVEILIPAVISEASEDTAAFLAYNSTQAGADESTQRIVVLDLDGQAAVCSFQLLRYGDNWRIQSHGATLSGMVNTGMAVLLSAEGLESLKAEFVSGGTTGQAGEAQAAAADSQAEPPSSEAEPEAEPAPADSGSSEEAPEEDTSSETGA